MLNHLEALREVEAAAEVEGVEVVGVKFAGSMSIRARRRSRRRRPAPPPTVAPHAQPHALRAADVEHARHREDPLDRVGHAAARRQRPLRRVVEEGRVVLCRNPSCTVTAPSTAAPRGRRGAVYITSPPRPQRGVAPYQSEGVPAFPPLEAVATVLPRRKPAFVGDPCTHTTHPRRRLVDSLPTNWSHSMITSVDSPGRESSPRFGDSLPIGRTPVGIGRAITPGRAMGSHRDHPWSVGTRPVDSPRRRFASRRRCPPAPRTRTTTRCRRTAVRPGHANPSPSPSPSPGTTAAVMIEPRRPRRAARVGEYFMGRVRASSSTSTGGRWPTAT